MNQNERYDAIVVGTGISGGWAAKELCENGLKTLVLERGPMVKHIEDYNKKQAGADKKNGDKTGGNSVNFSKDSFKIRHGVGAILSRSVHIYHTTISNKKIIEGNLKDNLINCKLSDF